MLLVLEGLPGAGKTSAMLDAKSSFDATLIPEIIGKEPEDATEGFYVQNDIAKYCLVKGSGMFMMDRNFTSTLAYNYSRTSPPDRYAYAEVDRRIAAALAAKTLWQPDLYLYLRCSPATSFARQKATNAAVWKDYQFLERVQHFYDEYLLGLPNVSVIDAGAPREKVLQEVKDILKPFKQYALRQARRRKNV